MIQYKWTNKNRTLLLAAALLALLTGVLLYLTTRLYQQPLFLNYLPETNLMPQIFSNSIIYSIPSFLHIYAFILLSTAVISANIVTVRLICIFWLAVELLFEIGQQPSLTNSIIDILPDWFNPVIANYFIYGHFDMLDVSALILGTIAAYFTVVISLTRQQSN